MDPTKHDLTEPLRALFDQMHDKGSLHLSNLKHYALVGSIPQKSFEVEDDVRELVDRGLVIEDQDDWFRVPTSQDDLLRIAADIAGEELSDPQLYALRVTTRDSGWHTDALRVATSDGVQRNTLESLRRRGVLVRIDWHTYRLADDLLKLGAKIVHDSPLVR